VGKTERVEWESELLGEERDNEGHHRHQEQGGEEAASRVARGPSQVFAGAVGVDAGAVVEEEEEEEEEEGRIPGQYSSKGQADKCRCKRGREMWMGKAGHCSRTPRCRHITACHQRHNVPQCTSLTRKQLRFSVCGGGIDLAADVTRAAITVTGLGAVSAIRN